MKINRWILMGVVLLCQTGAWRCPAATKTWTGAVSTDWFNDGNWDPGGMPESSDVVVISSGSIALPRSATVAGLNLTNANIAVQAGTLAVRGTGCCEGGTFTIAAGAVLNFVGGSYTLAPGARVDSAGIVRVSASAYQGLLVHNGAQFRTPRLEMDNSNAYLDHPVEVATLTVFNGLVHFGTPTVLDIVSLVGENSKATLSGTKDLTITNLVCAYAALQGSGTVNIPAGGSLSNSGAGLTLDGRILNLHGTATCVSVAGANGAVVNNFGRWELRDNWGVSSLTFSNYGQLVKTGGSGTASFTFAPCYNSGTVEIQSGTLILSGDSNATGSFTVAAGATLQFAGSYTLAPGAWVDSAGTVRVSAGAYQGLLMYNGAQFRTPRLETDNSNAYLDHPVEVATLTVFNGLVHFVTPTVLDTVSLVGENSKATLSGTKDLTITNLVCAYAALQGSGTVNIPAGGSLSNSGAGLTLDGRLLNLHGTATCVSVSGANGAVVNNFGRWELRDNWGVSSLTFSNYGQLIKTGGSGIAIFESAPCYNSGTVETLIGTLLFKDSFRQTAGFTWLRGGNLGGPSLELQGGLLGGAGTISGNLVNSALVAPGASPARLMIEGNYTQTAGGTLDIELAGQTAGTEYDQLQVSGSAALDGALAVRFINGYQPDINTTHQVVTCSTRGSTFAIFTCDPLIQPGNFINLRYQVNGAELYTTDPTPQFTFLRAQPPSGLIQIQITGVAGQKYAIECSPQLFSGWTPLYTNVMPGSTLLDWVDPDNVNLLKRFFRARFVP